MNSKSFLIYFFSLHHRITRLVRPVFKLLLKFKPTAKTINLFFIKKSISDQGRIHSIFSKIFRNNNSRIGLEKWKVKFNDKMINIPLKEDRLWLDWDSAVSIIGHDIDVKKTYLHLLKSTFEINCFFDVGANYCTHSLLSLSQGINTVSFEPNITCKKYFDDCLSLNNLKGQFENVAVGEKAGKGELTFPLNDTWLGTISAKEDDFVNKFENLKKKEVSIITLDAYVSENNIIPSLIKIDTEGFELNVLKGANKLLSEHKPLVIFEANEINKREELYDEFNSIGFLISDLIDDNNKFISKSKSEFISSKKTNFIGISRSHQLMND